ncbi:piggyBac transposable element-derived protein 4 [Trichonephila clavata]|uniref:PiggyBac transposable element-derived protein 4 n=1 Tax=Trichonephila clavata TaxID=2740835 RepID=A0A8X6FX56_TRICU|nr:piggyBac transposable element-derived protein 4 [Trichonephila clavata]
MPRKFLTQIEIENLMKDLDEENFDDSDSEYEDEFENSIFENNEVDLDVSANLMRKLKAYSHGKREVMPRDRFLMILKFLHFSDNSLKESRDSPTYDRLWKIRKIFDNFNRTFKEVYDPTENVSFDEVIIKFKGRIHFKQYIPKKRKQWGLKMYKIADATGYTYDMRVYLGKDKKENLSTSATYNVVNAMTDCIKGKGHKVFMDSFFSSPELYRDLLKEKKINSCGTVRPNRKHFPKNLAPCKMKQGDLAVKFCNGMTAMCWKDKRQVYMLTNMHSPRNEFIIDERKRFKKKIDGDVSESEKDRLSTTKPKIVADYNKHMDMLI